MSSFFARIKQAALKGEEDKASHSSASLHMAESARPSISTGKTTGIGMGSLVASTGLVCCSFS